MATLQYLLKWTTVGLAIAFIAVLLRPDLINHRGTVEIRHAYPEPGTTSPPPAAQTGATPVASYAPAVETAAPAVVNIYTAKVITERANPLADDPLLSYFFGDRMPAKTRQRVETSLGSGVILSAQGYLLTNHHVIQGADKIQVQLRDGRNAPAQVIGTDPETDLAVLHIDLPDLPAVTLGDSETLRVGDVVLAIGNPFGVGKTVTMGIVSATGRSELGINTFENFIQTDAAINPGNSGGALINTHGHLVGINTAIFSRSGGSQGIGFAIPAALATGVLEQIIEHGHTVRGWLGIEVQPLTPKLVDALELTTSEGVLIAGIKRGGPADLAGLLPGDLITHFNGQETPESRPLRDRITALQPGERIQIRGQRKGEPFELEVLIGERPRVGRP